MRILIIYILAFKESLCLLFLGISFIFALNHFESLLSIDQKNYLIQMIATLVGVGLSIFTASGFNKIQRTIRIKKTFAFLKLVTIPYLNTQIKSMRNTFNQFSDICTYSQAMAFMRISNNLRSVERNFDTSWFSLIYSQDFFDLVDDDEIFNSICHAILEINYYTSAIVYQSINASDFIKAPESLDTDEEFRIKAITKAKEIRGEVLNQIDHLEKYKNTLDTQIMNFLRQKGAKYTEIVR